MELIIKSTKILTYYNKYPGVSMTKCSKDIDITWSHLHKVINKYVNMGLITVIKKNRDNIVKLTNKGYKVANAINNLNNELKQ